MKSTYETMGGQYQQNGDDLMPNFGIPECHIKIFRVLTETAKTTVHTVK